MSNKPMLGSELAAAICHADGLHDDRRACRGYFFCPATRSDRSIGNRRQRRLDRPRAGKGRSRLEGRRTGGIADRFPRDPGRRPNTACTTRYAR
jgi:hypothetical protein